VRSMASRDAAYETKVTADELQELSTKLANQVRAQIRGMSNYEILSPSWTAMAEAIGRIASITDMESKLPKESEKATLWECEEQVLRHLIEDGKLNLCLRNLIEYTTYEWNTRGKDRDPHDEATMEEFEKGMGIILRNAWKHVEVLQTTDIPALVYHISSVLDGSLASPERVEALSKANQLHERQEVLVLHYLRDVAHHVEDISEDRLMPQILERRLIPTVISFLKEYWEFLQEKDLIVAIESLNLLVETEHFQTYEDEYLTPEISPVLCELQSAFLERLSGDSSVRRRISAVLRLASSCRYK